MSENNIGPTPIVPVGAGIIPPAVIPSAPVLSNVEGVEGSQCKKFPLLTSILLILLSFAAALAIYLFLQVRTLTLEKTAIPSPTPTPVASTDPTANWQAYPGKNYSIKYPKHWNNLESACVRLEVITSDAIERELSIKEYTTKNLFSGDESVYIGSIKNVQETGGKYGDLTLKFPNLPTEDVVVIGPQGEGELNNIIIRGPEGSGYFHIIVWFNGDPMGDNTICNDQVNEYKDLLSTFKFTTSNSQVPESINKIFTLVNHDFGVNLVPTQENEFYSLTGFVDKKSWKLNLLNLLTDKSQITLLFQTLEKQMKQDINSTADGVGQSVQGYENDQVYCFFLMGFNQSDYLSCVEK